MERNEIEKEYLPFSYDLACSLTRDYPYLKTTWQIIEKGTKKSNPLQRYVISPNIIKLAMCQIRQHIWRTACNKLQSQFLKDIGFKVYVKEELYQFTETVKARGVVYTLLQLSDEQKCKGVIAISTTGGFAYSLCYFGKKFGIPVTVVIPLLTPTENIRMCQNCADSRATVLVQGNNKEEAHEIALRIARTKGLVYIDGHDHPNMIIGQATLGIEICEDLRKIDAVILPTTINGCGLTHGIAMAIKGWNSKIKIIEVNVEDFNSTIDDIRIKTNSHSELDIPVEEYGWHKNDRGMPDCWIDNTYIVNETLVEHAAEFLLREENIRDRNAAIGLAVILSNQLDELKGKRIILPIFGNIDLIDQPMMNELELMDSTDPSFE